jgi:SpoVK/Ycf46/Vps4 family AAA+-type ATPase
MGSMRNLVAPYLGQTPGYVESLVSQALETSGVLFIDEASNLNDTGDSKENDSYAKCAINTLMELMEEKKADLTVIFSGYQNEMEKNLINANQGMRRRIQWFFHIDAPSASELHQIFQLKIKQEGLILEDVNHFDEDWFSTHYRKFPYYGGSIVNLIDKIKLVNPSFGVSVKNVISKAILDEGFDAYIKYVLSK